MNVFSLEGARLHVNLPSEARRAVRALAGANIVENAGGASASLGGGGGVGAATGGLDEFGLPMAP